MATIDDHLEALNKTIELLAKMQIETERAIKAAAVAHAKTEETVEKLGRFAMSLRTHRG
jgi:hypothetical protein